jgi:hypothetical protein
MSGRATPHALALGVWLLVVGGAMATRPFKKGLFGPDGLESMAFLVLLLAFASSRRLRALLASIGRPRALLVTAVLALVLWGQLVRDNRVSFPFLQWSMYTKKDPPNDYLEYVARYRSGDTGLFPFGRLTSFSGSQLSDSQGRVLENRITKWLDPEEGEVASDAARAELAKLVATYNAGHGDDPVVHLAVMRRSVPIRGFTGRESIRSEQILELRFDD